MTTSEETVVCFKDNLREPSKFPVSGFTMKHAAYTRSFLIKKRGGGSKYGGSSECNKELSLIVLS